MDSPAGDRRRGRGQWRVTAPVQKQHRLFAGRQRLSNGGHQAGRQPVLAIHLFAAHVNRPDRRQRRAGEPCRWDNRRYLPRHTLSTSPATGWRSKMTGNPRYAPAHRHVAGVVDDAFVLLEAGIVALVDDDQPEIAIGSISADRAPTTSFARRVAAPASCAGAATSARRNATPGRRPEALLKPVEPIGGSATSGSRTITRLSARSAAAIASKYTSVLPDPVTPSSRVTEYPLSTAATSSPAAAAGLPTEQHRRGLDQAGRPARLPGRRPVAERLPPSTPG